MKHSPIIIILLLSISVTSSAAEKIKETPHYDVVAEYIRSLGRSVNGRVMDAARGIQENIDDTYLSLRGCS
jgi:hypothetical protein